MNRQVVRCLMDVSMRYFGLDVSGANEVAAYDFGPYSVGPSERDDVFSPRGEPLSLRNSVKSSRRFL